MDTHRVVVEHKFTWRAEGRGYPGDCELEYDVALFEGNQVASMTPTGRRRMILAGGRRGKIEDFNQSSLSFIN